LKKENAGELIIANKELVFQDTEKENDRTNHMPNLFFKMKKKKTALRN
jgi:hypothetical protein